MHRAPADVGKVFRFEIAFVLISKILLRVILLTLICFRASAQTAPSNLYWFRYFNQIHFNSKWSWQNEFDERRSINPDQQRQFIIHSYANFKPKANTNFATGITRSWVTNSKNLTVPELRFFQSVTSNVATFDKFNVQFRFRLEERFLHKTDTEKINLMDGYNFKFRTRYRVQFQCSLDKNQKWLARLSDEIMYHTDSGDLWKFDQNRIYAGVERKLTKQLSVEIGYLLVHFLSNDQVLRSNIARTTLYHRIGL